ncbi:hypothetical protein COCON_G00087880 [Conger conger]|uniref:G-protein coupled receptors family 1 profile domain-containing protein n=1 Tax=Conger conger TaxID=82655 RepID=A0A9Q1I0K0_CONCO|nr:hypothetical protein COCON_G00087880 [Conger conger]
MVWNQSERCNLTITEEVRVFEKVAYIPVFALGLLLNSAALCLFLVRRRSWTETHVYMVNLVLADLALILPLPFRIYSVFHRSEVWDFCPLLIAVHYVNMYASILTLTAISVHRFAVVRFPFSARAGRWRKQTAAVLCVLIWVAVAAICAKLSQAHTRDKLQTCFDRVAGPLPLWIVLVVFVVGYLLPCCVILFCSGQTIVSLLGDKEGITQEKRKCVAVIAANLVVFVRLLHPVPRHGPR